MNMLLCMISNSSAINQNNALIENNIPCNLFFLEMSTNKLNYVTFTFSWKVYWI